MTMMIILAPGGQGVSKPLWRTAEMLSLTIIMRRMMLLFEFWQAADHAQKTKLLQILRGCDVF